MIETLQVETQPGLGNPQPQLDGGHLLFLLIEKIKGSPVSVRVFQYSQVLGLVLVLALVVFVTYNDILRLL